MTGPSQKNPEIKPVKQYDPIGFGDGYNPRSVEGQYRANTARNRHIQDAHLKEQLEQAGSAKRPSIFERLRNKLYFWRCGRHS